MRELALFSGAGGGILGGHLLGWRTICAVERDAYAAQVLAQRQNDGILRPFPIWSDVTTFDGRPWQGIVDVVSGGFPCQDISAAGKGAGITGARSGMWKEMARIIGEVRPRYVFVENSQMLTTRGLGVVLGDLASMGFDAEWGVLGSAHANGFCLRERLWILASNDSQRWNSSREREAHNKFKNKKKIDWQTSTDRKTHLRLARSRYTAQILSSNGRGCDEFSTRVDRLKAIGNAQDSYLAATAFELLRDRLNDN